MNELLAKIGWTQAEFARQVGASTTTVGRWCRGEGGVAYRVAVKYLECLLRGMGK